MVDSRHPTSLLQGCLLRIEKEEGERRKAKEEGGERPPPSRLLLYKRALMSQAKLRPLSLNE